MTDTTATDHMARRKGIAAKIRALLTKTVANGCTEEEALIAAEHAGKLMEEYDLEYQDIEAEVRTESYGARRREFCKGGNGRRRTFHPVFMVTTAIAEYFDCKVWSHDHELVYFGSATDTDLAHSMTDLLRLAMDTECAAYLRSSIRTTGINTRTLRSCFMSGMVDRLCERLKELKRTRTAPAKGHAVMVIKDHLTEEKFAIYARQNNLNLRARSGYRNVRSESAYRAGQAAAGRVDLGGAKLAARS